MKMLVQLSSLLAVGFCCSACSTVTKPVQESPRASLQAPAQMPTPEQLQAAFKKASTPTIEHSFLKEFVGTWNVTSKMQMSPESKPEVSMGTSVVTSDMDGKFLREVFLGTMMGKEFRGFGLTGYDTITREFSSVWIDSMSTAMMTSTGTYNPATKTLVLNGSMSCPIVDGKRSVSMTHQIIDSNHNVFAMYDTAPDGSQFKSLEISYVRVK